ncbi:PD-(D/E)XK nuclease family protein [Capnocytophaga canis]|uniref:PD-(D/E)XK nuclease family protein n=1 Tax=Capnocytophaga canis TaxID=1848903 RepID=UPI00385F09C3
MFLKNVITDVLEQYATVTERIIFVTSGKRPALFLKKYFAEQTTKVSIAPEFISIAELLQQISGVQEVGNQQLLFELYETYRNTCQTTPDDFETFIGWGQTLLKDFSDIDHYLVQSEKIFPYIHALKEAEHWSGFEKQTEMQQKYLDFWNTLGDYYFAFNEKLNDTNHGYAGFVAKKAVEKLPKYIQENSHKIHIFVGFNALSKVEQQVVQSILMDTESEIYWDIDKYFMDNVHHDAGYFIRKYKNNWRYYNQRKKEFKWLTSSYEESKNIEIIGVPKSVNQAHTVAGLLREIPHSNMERTALVIGDEHLLIPVLQSISSDIPVNVTMGYPLQQTPLNDLFVAFFRLHLSKSYRYKDVLHLLTQPFLQEVFSGKGISQIIQHIKEKNLTYLSKAKLMEITPDEDKEIMEVLFPEKTDDYVTDLINSALNIIYRIKNAVESDKNENILGLEYAYRFYQLFNQLQTLQGKYGYIDSVKTLYHFYLDILQKSSLNFEGEPLEGLQVMGVLESRSLDFDNIIITSVNEGVMPMGKSGNSLIPYDVKFHLEMPTYKDKDAIYSYNFYRMLQSAKNIYLIYDTENGSLKSKEKSRFILQLLSERNPNHRIQYQVKAPEVYPAKGSMLQIPKTEAVFQRLREMADKGLSPSAITNYILNPRIFYQQNVLQVYEERDVEETIEARTFGDIVHEVLETLYKPFLNTPLKQHHYIEMQSKLEALIEEKFVKYYKNEDFKLGKNLLIFNVIHSYLKRFLDLEQQEVEKGTELVVLHLEEKIRVPFVSDKLLFPVYIKGIIDRIDMRDGVLHIIDYKTGIVEENAVGIADWNLLVTDFKYSKAFQLLSYAYMYQQRFGYQECMIVGNISFKRLNMGLIKFHTKEKVGRTYVKDCNINSFILDSYKEYTEALLAEIFDISIPFTEKE